MSEDLSIYIHVPFCIRKCGYCDFYSLENLDLIPDLARALEQEIRLCTGIARTKEAGKKRQVSTLYFGGGTPSLLPVPVIESILQVIDDIYRIHTRAEITFEVNPGALDTGYLTELRQLGINRLSIGVQSFDAEKLRFLTRIHTVADSLKTIDQARTAGFENMGLDLMYALPGEAPADWKKDLERAVRMAPAHLSCYMLTLEPGTPLHRQAEKKIFVPPGPETRAELFLQTSEFLEHQGYTHYEISNFSRGRASRSRHNAGYWNMTDYRGLGPSAHSFEHPDQSDPQRSWNMADVTAYIRILKKGCLPVEDREILSLTQQKLERIMLGLRTREGMDICSYTRDLEEDFTARFREIILRLEDQGLAKMKEESLQGPGSSRFRLTRKGWTCLDSIVQAFADTLME